MGQQAEEYNYWAQFTVAELRDLYWDRDKRLARLNAEPVNYYSAGYSDTYLSAMSQVWGIERCREEMREIKAEITRRSREEEDTCNG